MRHPKIFPQFKKNPPPRQPFSLIHALERSGAPPIRQSTDPPPSLSTPHTPDSDPTQSEEGLGFRAALKQGLLAVERYDDVLGKSLPNSQHPGRVRAVGGLIPIRKTYEKSSIRRRRAPSSSEVEIEARVEAKVEEKVREIEERLRAEMRQEMKYELALLLQQTMGQQEKTFTPTVNQSSCQSVKPIAALSGFTEEAELSCKLKAVVNGNTIHVAMGTILVPVVPGGTIHSRPMPPDHARVMVDGICNADFIDLPLPIPNGEQETL